MDKDELLRQLDILANYMPQYFAIDDEILKLKGRLFKPYGRINELEQKKKQIFDIVFPYLDLVPRECLVPEAITLIRDSIRFGRANTLFEALQLYDMKKQQEWNEFMQLKAFADHDRHRRNGY